MKGNFQSINNILSSMSLADCLVIEAIFMFQLASQKIVLGIGRVVTNVRMSRM